MRRMSREFSLVLLGSGLLTAGYFAYPEADLQAKAEKEAAQRVGGRSHGHMHILFLPGFSTHSRTMAGTGVGGARSAAMPAVSKGGFGSFGARASGVS